MLEKFPACVRRIQPTLRETQEKEMEPVRGQCWTCLPCGCTGDRPKRLTEQEGKQKLFKKEDNCRNDQLPHELFSMNWGFKGNTGVPPQFEVKMLLTNEKNMIKLFFLSKTNKAACGFSSGYPNKKEKKI